MGLRLSLSCTKISPQTSQARNIDVKKYRFIVSLFLNSRQQKFSDASIRFYSAECVLALHYLHKIGFAHLDLQPENVLLDRFGHIRLADFGAAVKMDKGGRFD